MNINPPEKFWRDRTLWTVLAISSLFLLLPLIEPFDFDSSIEKSFAIDLIKWGKVPFIGSFDQNFPGIVYFYTLAILIFGSSDIQIRLFDVVISLSFAGFLYRFWSRWLPTKTAAIAAMLYILYYVSGGPDLYEKRDAYVIMSILISIAFLIPIDEKRASLLKTAFAGLIAGIALLLRPTSLLFLCVIPSYLFIEEDFRPRLNRFPFAFIFFFFSLVPLGMDLLYYNTIPNGIAAFYTATIQFNLDMYAGLNGTDKPFWEFLRTGLLIPLAMIGVSIYRSNRLRMPLSNRLTRRDEALFASLVLSALIIVVVMHKFFRYHLVPFFVLLTPLTAIGLQHIINKIQNPVRQHYGLLCFCFLCSFITYNPKGPLGFLLGLFEKRDPVEVAYETRNRSSTIGARYELAVRSFLSQPENRAGRVEICSFDPRLRSHLDRQFAGNYVVLYPLGLRLNGMNTRPRFSDYQQVWQKAYMDSLRVTRPRFIILAREYPFWYLTDVYDDCLHYLPGFDSLLTYHYAIDTTIGGFQIFERK